MADNVVLGRTQPKVEHKEDRTTKDFVSFDRRRAHTACLRVQTLGRVVFGIDLLVVGASDLDLVVSSRLLLYLEVREAVLKQAACSKYGAQV